MDFFPFFESDPTILRTTLTSMFAAFLMIALVGAEETCMITFYLSLLSLSLSPLSSLSSPYLSPLSLLCLSLSSLAGLHCLHSQLVLSCASHVYGRIGGRRSLRIYVLLESPTEYPHDDIVNSLNRLVVVVQKYYYSICSGPYLLLCSLRPYHSLLVSDFFSSSLLSFCSPSFPLLFLLSPQGFLSTTLCIWSIPSLTVGGRREAGE